MSHQRPNFQTIELIPREIDIDICLKTIVIYQKIDGHENGILWDASLVLAKYLETMCQKNPEFLSGKKVLELGAGLGVVGLTTAVLGAQVTMTDIVESLPVLCLNIDINKETIASMGGYATAEKFVWDDINSEIYKQEFDFVLLADCIYYEEAIEPLLQTLQRLTKAFSQKPAIYISQEVVNTDDVQKTLWEMFYEKLTDFFSVEKIPEDHQHSSYRSADIVLFKLIKK